MNQNRAATRRHDQWTGWRFGEPILRLWGAPRDINVGLPQMIVQRLSGSYTINAFSLNETSLAKAAELLVGRRTTLLVGYASALTAFADYLKELGRRPNHSLRGIVSTAEVLSEDDRELVESVLGVKVFNRYGCQELGLQASECEAGSMHSCAENCFLEFEDPAAESSAILVTSLTNRVMPLIRYRIGDEGGPGASSCPCGRGLPVVQPPVGRTTDYLRKTDGGRISGPALTLVFKDLTEVKQVQLYQPCSGRLVVRLVRRPGYGTATESKIQERLRLYCGEGMKMTFDYQDSIGKEPSGKYCFVISEVVR